MFVEASGDDTCVTRPAQNLSRVYGDEGRNLCIWKGVGIEISYLGLLMPYLDHDLTQPPAEGMFPVEPAPAPPKSSVATCP